MRWSSLSTKPPLPPVGTTPPTLPGAVSCRPEDLRRDLERSPGRREPCVVRAVHQQLGQLLGRETGVMRAAEPTRQLLLRANGQQRRDGTDGATLEVEPGTVIQLPEHIAHLHLPQVG